MALHRVWANRCRMAVETSNGRLRESISTSTCSKTSTRRPEIIEAFRIDHNSSYTSRM